MGRRRETPSPPEVPYQPPSGLPMNLLSPTTTPTSDNHGVHPGREIRRRPTQGLPLGAGGRGVRHNGSLT